MRLDERLRDGEPIVSFEFLPPRTVEAELAFWSAIEELAALEPAFVSVTCGAGGTTRDLTLAVVRRLARERGLEAVPHVTATGFTRDGLRRAAGRGRRGRRGERAGAARRPAARAGHVDGARGRRAQLARADRARRRGRLLRARRRLPRAASRLARLGRGPRAPAREGRRRRARARHPAVLRQRRLPPLRRAPARRRHRRAGAAGDHPDHQRGPDRAADGALRRLASRPRCGASSSCARTTRARSPSSAWPTRPPRPPSCWGRARRACTSTRSIAPRPRARSSRRCAPTAHCRPPSRRRRPTTGGAATGLRETRVDYRTPG